MRWVRLSGGFVQSCNTIEMMSNGNAYRLTKRSGVTRDVRLVEYDPISKRHMVRPVNRPTSVAHAIRMSDYVSIRPIRPCAIKKKKSVRSTHLYIFKISPNTYKFGCSYDVGKRMRTGKTWCPMMERVATRKIPDKKSSKWRDYEDALKQTATKGKCPTGGTEVFRLSSRELHAAKSFLATMRF